MWSDCDISAPVHQERGGAGQSRVPLSLSTNSSTESTRSWRREIHDGVALNAKFVFEEEVMKTDAGGLTATSECMQSREGT